MTTTTHGYGRIAHFDDRSRGFPMHPLLDHAAALVSKTWRRPGAYDQGQTPECVAYAAYGLLHTTPVKATVPAAKLKTLTFQQLYDGAQSLDGDTSPHDGTTGIAAMKWLKANGLIGAYRWCFGIQDTLKTLSQRGPVIVGLNWHAGMEDPDSDGLIHPTGEILGGHETEWIGLDVKRQRIIGENSWGTDWGHKGRYELTFADAEKLLNDDGDVVTCVDA